MLKNLFQGIRKQSDSTILLVILIIALLIRISYSYVAYKSNVMELFADDMAYKHFGEQVINQGFFVPDLDSLGSYAGVVGPAIGWILGLIFFCFGVSWMPVFAVNSLIGALTCYILYLTGKEIINPGVGLFSAAYLAIYLPLIRFTATAGKEIWMTFLLLLSVYLVFKLIKEVRVSTRVLILGIVFTLLIHLDERFLFLAPVFFLFLLLAGDQTGNMRLKKASIFSVLVIVLSIPWLIRNYAVYDRIILISVRTNSVTEKLLGYEPNKYFNDDYKRLWYISPERIDSVKSGLVKTFDNGTEISAPQIKAIQKGRIPHDFSRTETMWASFKRFWQPFLLSDGMYFHDGYRFISWSKKHNLVVIAFYSWLLLVMPFGFRELFSINRQGFWFLIISIVLYMLVHVILIPFTTDRYRIPLDPFLILIGITGLMSVLNRNFKTAREII